MIYAMLNFKIAIDTAYNAAVLDTYGNHYRLFLYKKDHQHQTIRCERNSKMWKMDLKMYFLFLVILDGLVKTLAKSA